MNQKSVKPPMKFPIAAVFYILSVLWSGLNILTVFVQLYERHHNLRVALGGVFASCLNLILPMFIILILLLRKRNFFLFLFLGLQSVFSAGRAVNYFLMLRYEEWMYNPLYHMTEQSFGLYTVFYVLLCATMFLFAIDCLCPVTIGYNRFLKKMWFLPIVFYLLMGAGILSCRSWPTVIFWMTSNLIPGILNCVADTTLCWWITGPYKKGYVPAPKPAPNSAQFPFGEFQTPYGAPSTSYGAPNAAYGAPNTAYGAPSTSYGAPNAAYVTPASAAQPKFCTRCGKPVMPGNAFCTACGAPIPKTTSSEQTASTQTTTPPAANAPFRNDTDLPVGESALPGRR